LFVVAAKLPDHISYSCKFTFSWSSREAVAVNKTS
jgi:hypothetical protein